MKKMIISSSYKKSHHRSISQRDLLSEINHIIKEQSIKIGDKPNNYQFNYEDDHLEDDHDENERVQEISILTQKTNSPKKQYRRSPLGYDNKFMPPDIADIGEEVNNSDSVDNYEIESSVKFRNYKNNNDVAFHCQKLLKITAYPTVAQITILIHEIIRSQPANSQEIDLVKKKVLQWFRKRREYLALKVYNVCDELMESVWDTIVAQADVSRITKLSYDEIVEVIVSDDYLMEVIFKAAKLPVKDETNGISFVRRKVKDYFNKLCTRAND